MMGGKTKNPYKGFTAIKAQGRQIDRQTDKEGRERNRERGRDRDRERKKTEGMVREKHRQTDR